MRLIVALVGSAIGFAWPTSAQQTLDPTIEQQIRALAQKYDEAINNHDPGAVAALYTHDGVRPTNEYNQEHFTVGRPSKKRMRIGISSNGSSAIISPGSIG
jgi:hypothetical protein